MVKVPHAGREQVFLLRYKSEPSTVESSISKYSAHCQHCLSDFSVAHSGKNKLSKKHCP